MARKKSNETSRAYGQTNEAGSNDPMSPGKISSHEPTAIKRDPNKGVVVEPVRYDGGNNILGGKQMRVEELGKSGESTPGVSAAFSCEECGKTFGSRQELKDHTQEH